MKVISNDKKHVLNRLMLMILMNWGSTWIEHLLKEQKIAYDGIQDSGGGV